MGPIHPCCSGTHDLFRAFHDCISLVVVRVCPVIPSGSDRSITHVTHERDRRPLGGAHLRLVRCRRPRFPSRSTWRVPVSVHLPSLPSSAAWETPLTVSREVLGALSDAADSAAETAGHLIHPRRSRSRVRAVASSKWTAIVLAVVAGLVVASVVRRSRAEDAEVDARNEGQRGRTQDESHDGEARESGARSAGNRVSSGAGSRG
jgi:hypothetical protein